LAKERKASVIYDGNASQLTYAFPFDYLRKAFVKVEDIYTSITELEQGTDYTVSDKEVVLTKGIPIGHYVKIYRKTTTTPLVEWQDASVLKASDMSLQEVQMLHLMEENNDYVGDTALCVSRNDDMLWDGTEKRLTNINDPLESQDAVTLKYLIETLKKVPMDEYADKTFFEVDVKGGIMPAEYPVYSKNFELDPNGDITTVL